MNQEDKNRIAARLFYQDNPDEYDNYREALIEFMSGNNVSDAFVDYVVSPLIKPIEGHSIFTNDEGHVISFRQADGFISPLTEISADEGEQLHEALERIIDENPEADNMVILSLGGWRHIC